MFNKKQFGFSLNEILIALAIIGAISALCIPFILNSSTTNSLKARQANAIEILHNCLQLAASETGLFPLDFGPGKIFKENRLKTISISNANLNDVPSNCKQTVDNNDVVANNDVALKLQNGMMVYGLNSAWKPNEGKNGKAGDWVCIYSKEGSTLSLLERQDSGSATSAGSALAQGASSSSEDAQTSSNSTNINTAQVSGSGTTPQLNQKASFRVLIRNQLTGVGIPGANLTGTLSGTADGNGVIVFHDVPNGTDLHLTGVATGYANSFKRVTASSNIGDVYIDLTPTVSFRVLLRNKLTGIGISGANLTGTLSGTADGNGVIVFNNILHGTDLHLTGAATGYANNFKQVTATSNTGDVYIDLTPTVSFRAISRHWYSGIGIGQAQISGTLNGLADGNGVTVFHNVLVGSDLHLTSVAGGYDNAFKRVTATQGMGDVYFDMQPTPIDVIYGFSNSPLATLGQVAQSLLNDYLASGNMSAWIDYSNLITIFVNFMGGNYINGLSQNLGVAAGTMLYFDRNGNIVQRGAQGLGVQEGNIVVTSDGTRLRLTNDFATPVKISLKGHKAKLDSNDKYLFDYDGFAKNNMPMIQPAGGLNPDEAWLVFDRKRNGIVDHLDILDGDDVFGDHVHKVANGYLDMGQVFQKSLKRDNEGKLYFEVKKLAVWEKWWINMARFFGQMKDPIPSIDLKLVDRQKHIMPASDYLQKVYVDYWSVDEWDKGRNNWIGQRAKVQFTDGHWSESADQWFKIGLRLTPLPSEPKKNNAKAVKS